MKYKPILVVAGEPNSIFLEIFFKSIFKLKNKHPLILIASVKLIKLQMRKLKINKKIKVLEYKNLFNYKLTNNSIYILNVNYETNFAFENISSKSNKYIKNCFKLAFEILKKSKINKLINGPIVKKTFLKKKYPGITEYISDAFGVKKSAMLIYNDELSVCPLTTHVPLKSVAKKINKKIIFEKVKLINSFYKKKFNKIPNIAILGLNPHCESIAKFSEDEKIIKPTVQSLKKLDFKVSGPFSADTIFMKQNRKKFDVIIGMYHDQVLAPFKSIFKFDAINLTLGLKYLRVSPDHGIASDIIGKNKANPKSLMECINFLNKI